jgi:hypothetical protein
MRVLRLLCCERRPDRVIEREHALESTALADSREVRHFSGAQSSLAYSNGKKT